MAYPKPDQAAIDKLVTQIKRDPSGLKYRKLLMQQYLTCGWFKEAGAQAIAILNIDPTDGEAKKTRELEDRHAALKMRANVLYTEAKLLQNLKGMPASEFTGLIASFAAIAKVIQPSSSMTKTIAVVPTKLVNSTALVKASSAGQGRSSAVVNKVSSVNPPPPTRNQTNTQPVTGTSNKAPAKVTSVPRKVEVKPTKSAKDVAADITGAFKSSRTKALEIAFEDLKREIKSKARDQSNDREEDRQASLRRMNVVKSYLSSRLQPLADRAHMHVEHEVLQRKYTNQDTMGLEPVSEIPRANFWVSEDAYAWDMEELAAAISSNRGIMRNPLSKLMFHPRDVREIVQHPLGKHLAALQVDQSELKAGVRPRTIEKLDTLAQKLLADETEDFAPSHRAVEAFIVYVATLPDNEQKAIDTLWVPARDSHTGMQFDATVGEALKDAQNNLVCIHKTGDLLSQAVAYLSGGGNYYAGY